MLSGNFSSVQIHVFPFSIFLHSFSTAFRWCRALVLIIKNTKTTASDTLWNGFKHQQWEFTPRIMMKTNGIAQHWRFEKDRMRSRNILQADRVKKLKKGFLWLLLQSVKTFWGGKNASFLEKQKCGGNVCYVTSWSTQKNCVFCTEHVAFDCYPHYIDCK